MKSPFWNLAKLKTKNEKNYVLLYKYLQNCDGWWSLHNLKPCNAQKTRNFAVMWSYIRHRNWGISPELEVKKNWSERSYFPVYCFWKWYLRILLPWHLCSACYTFVALKEPEEKCFIWVALFPRVPSTNLISKPNAWAKTSMTEVKVHLVISSNNAKFNHKPICQEIQLHFYICPQKQCHLKSQPRTSYDNLHLLCIKWTGCPHCQHKALDLRTGLSGTVHKHFSSCGKQKICC